MGNRIEVYRKTDDGTQTLSLIQVVNELGGVLYECVGLELPWKQNKKRVSCIPPGEYKLVEHTSPKFGKCYWVQDVPGRSEILIHGANHYHQLLGCLAIGRDFARIDGDKYIDVTASKATLEDLLSYECDSIEFIG